MPLLAVLAIVSCASDAASAAEDSRVLELKVMSFNVRFTKAAFSEARPENNWRDPQHPRRERAIRVIREYGPDVLGVQEARHVQIVDFEKAFPELEFYGVGRDDGKKGGEYAGIFYRRERFKQLGEGSFWLSDTPEKPGTTFYKAPNAVPRMASWVRLRDKQTGRLFCVLNTHWDHISDEARRKSARLIRARLSEISDGLPTIVMGDLNVPEDAPATKRLIGAPDDPYGQLTDSYRVLHGSRSPDESTFNDWTGTTKGSRIDFILCSPQFKPVAAAIVRTSYEDLYPSDHYPVTATLRLDGASK